MSAPFESVFRSQPEEHAFRVASVQGEIPSDLSGTLLRAGPGRMQIGGDALNFFDGHALISGVSFADGAATFRSRHVHTPLIDEEVAKQSVLKRRIFTNLSSRWKNLGALDFGNSVMHDVYAWGDGDRLRVIAGNDPGHVALDPRTLATIGPERFGLPKGEEVGPMPYPDPHTGRLVTWTKKPGGLKPDALRFVEIDPTFAIVRSTPYHPLAGAPVVVHDQRATARWHVAVEQSLRISPLKALWGASTAYEALRTPPGGTATVLLVPREGDGGLVRVALPPPFQIAFHVINAYDDGDHVVVDLVTYAGRLGFEGAFARAARPPGVPHSPPPTPTRVVIDPKAGRVVDAKELGSMPGEAPEVADAVMGRPYRFAYFPTTSGAEADAPDPCFYGFFGAVGKIDVGTGEGRKWSAGGALVSPVAFVARPGATDEDDGWLLTWLLREDGAGVAVLDARDVEKGPVATLDLGVHLPGVSHVRWAAGLRLDA